MDSRLVEVALGLALAFAIVAAAGAVITELVARLMGLRARFLLQGLRELLDDDDVPKVDLVNFVQTYGAFWEPPDDTAPRSATEAVLGSPILQAQGVTGSVGTRKVTLLTRKGQLSKVSIDGRAVAKPLRALPSYISARSFSAAVVDLVVPNSAGKTSLDSVRSRVAAIEGFPALKGQLGALLKSVEGDVTDFREVVEGWYDDHMDRVSGWYKRHVAKWSFAIGVVLVLLFNVNAIAIASTLYTDDSARAAVTAVATSASNCPDDESAGDCLTRLSTDLSDARVAGLPIGWAVVAECRIAAAKCNWLESHGIQAPGEGWFDLRPVLVLLGWLITMIALVPGARFWFDLLSKLGSLRTTGPKPAARR